MSRCGDSDEWTISHVRRSNVEPDYRFSSANTPRFRTELFHYYAAISTVPKHRKSPTEAQHNGVLFDWRPVLRLQLNSAIEKLIVGSSALAESG